MQNLIQKFRQSSIVFEKPGIYTVQYFLMKPPTRFLLTNVYKRVRGIFFILLTS